jgi:hypothetical protein
MSDHTANTIIASLLWGAIGTGFLIYGKKQSAMIPLFGGIALVGVSYFVDSALSMSLISVALIAAMIFAIKRGW